MSGVNAIADVYRAVIADVINQMKESFLDENIDADILSQLKKEWEDKVMSSGCVDLNPPNHMIPQQQVQIQQQRQQQNIAPPPIRPSPQMIQQQQQRIPPQSQNPPQNVVAAAALQQQLRLAAIGAGNAVSANDQHTLRNLYTQQPGVQVQQQNLGNMQLHHQTQIRAQFPQQTQQQQPQFLLNSHNFQPGQVIMVQQPNGTQVPMSINNLAAGQQIRILPQNPTNSGNSSGNPQLSHMNQLDGNFAAESLTENPSRSEEMVKKVKKFGKLAKNGRKMKVRGEGAS
ncbi:unnamed protein product, partial [Caenorhabditis angaria]